MAKNLQFALIVLLVFIGIFFYNKSSQSKHKSSTEAIFSKDPEDIFKFLIQKGEEAIELARVDAYHGASQVAREVVQQKDPFHVVVDRAGRRGVGRPRVAPHGVNRRFGPDESAGP